MVKKLLQSTVLFSLLAFASCSSKPVINHVNLIPVQTSTIQQSINQGYNSRMVGHNAEWSKYALRISTGCPLDYSTMKVDRQTFDTPVFNGNGYIDMVYNKGGYTVYVQPTLIENYQNIYHINMLVSMQSRGANTGYVFTKKITFPSNDSGGYKLPITTPLWRFDIASGVTCEMQATVLPSSGTMSRRIWNDGVGSNEFGNGERQLGKALSMENDGGTIADVMENGGNANGMASRSPTFHDPFNVNQGGMGEMVR